MAWIDSVRLFHTEEIPTASQSQQRMKGDEPSPDGDQKRSVAEAERRLAAAHVRLDLEAIDSLLHPDYRIIQPGGRVETKEQVLASYRSGTRHWDSATSDQLEVWLEGDTAIVIGRWAASGRNGAEAFDYTARFLSVWVRHGGRWRNLTSQSTDESA